MSRFTVVSRFTVAYVKRRLSKVFAQPHPHGNNGLAPPRLHPCTNLPPHRPAPLPSPSNPLRQIHQLCQLPTSPLTGRQRTHMLYPSLNRLSHAPPWQASPPCRPANMAITILPQEFPLLRACRWSHNPTSLLIGTRPVATSLRLNTRRLHLAIVQASRLRQRILAGMKLQATTTTRVPLHRLPVHPLPSPACFVWRAVGFIIGRQPARDRSRPVCAEISYCSLTANVCPSGCTDWRSCKSSTPRGRTLRQEELDARPLPMAKPQMPDVVRAMLNKVQALQAGFNGHPLVPTTYQRSNPSTPQSAGLEIRHPLFELRRPTTAQRPTNTPYLTPNIQRLRAATPQKAPSARSRRSMRSLLSLPGTPRTPKVSQIRREEPFAGRLRLPGMPLD